MALSIQEIASLSITVFFGILLALFIWQTVSRHRSARALVISLACGLLGGIFAIISTGVIIPLTGYQSAIFLSLQLNTYSFQFFFFYIFLERLVSKGLNTIRLTIVMSLLLLQTLSLWFIIIFHVVSEVTTLLWFFADFAYNTLAFVTYGFGIIVYIRIYLYTREIKPIIFSLACVLIILGFIISSLIDYIGFFWSVPGWLNNISELGLVIPLLGIIIFAVTYLSNINWIYRLPNDIFLLIVNTSSGIPLHYVKLKTRLKVKIDENLLSGMISAINNVFIEIFKTKNIIIRNISSGGIYILMEQGPQQKIVTMVITNKVTFFLEKALQRYAKIFEKKFANELNETIQNTDVYDEAIKFLKPIFPFIIIDESYNNLGRKDQK